MSDTRSKDEAAIRTVLAGIYQAWGNDADAFVADYTEDATAILPGSFRRSREEVRQSMADGFASFLKGSTTRDEIRSIRFLGKDAAVVVSETGILFLVRPRCRPTGSPTRRGCWRSVTRSGCSRPTTTARPMRARKNEAMAQYLALIYQDEQSLGDTYAGETLAPTTGRSSRPTRLHWRVGLRSSPATPRPSSGRKAEAVSLSAMVRSSRPKNSWLATT